MYRGDIRLGETLDIKFTTRQFSSGAPFTLVGSPSIGCYVANGTTEITAGITLTVDFDGRTGLNNVRIVVTSGNGFTVQTNVDVVIIAGTVDGVPVAGEVIGSFSIENRSPIMAVTAANKYAVVDAAGLVDSNAVKVGPTGSGTAQTARDLGATLGVAGAGLTALGDTRIANLDAAVSSRMATYAQPAGFLAATFPTTVASPTNITAGTITTVTSVTNNVNAVLANTAHGGTSATLTLERLIAASTTTNEPAFKLTGNGTAAGLLSTGGATGSGVQLVSGVGGSYGFRATGNVSGGLFQGTNSHGLDLEGGNTGYGLFLAGTAGDISSATVGQLLTDTTDIKARLPATLVSGRMDASVGAMAANTLTAAATAADFGTEVGTAVWANGTRTLTSLSGLTVDVVTTLTNLPTIPANWLTAAGTAADFGTEIGTAVWANGTKTLTSLSGLTVDVVTTLTNLPTIPANWLTAAGIAADAGTELAAAVWDLTTTGHTTSGTFGAAMVAAGSAGDPWSTLLPGSYGAGTAGNILGNRLDAAVTSRLAPTVAGRTLDVSVAGEAGIDWANIGSPTAVVGLSGTTLGTVSTLTDKVGFSLSAAGVDAIWDEALSGHAAAGSAGAALSAAGSAGDPWGTVLPGSYTAGTAGHKIGTYLDAAVSGVAVDVLTAPVLLIPTTSDRYLDSDGNPLSQFTIKQAIAAMLVNMTGDRTGLGTEAITAAIPGVSDCAITAERESTSTVRATVTVPSE